MQGPRLTPPPREPIPRFITHDSVLTLDVSLQSTDSPLTTG